MPHVPHMSLLNSHHNSVVDGKGSNPSWGSNFRYGDIIMIEKIKEIAVMVYIFFFIWYYHITKGDEKVYYE